MIRIITEKQKMDIIKWSAAGYQNRQIAIECGMKHATLLYWKRKLRSSGIALPALLGRPQKGSNKEIKLIGKIENL